MKDIASNWGVADTPAFDRVDTLPARRRDLLVGSIIGASMIAMLPTSAAAQTTTAPTLSNSARDGLNFLLSVEYLLNQYYRIGIYNIKSLESSRISGTGTPGLPIGGRQVKFATGSTIRPVMTEILFQQGGHIDMLRAILTNNIVSQPAMNIAGDDTGAFTQFARYARFVGPTDTFDPYASDLNFLIGGYIIEEGMQRVLRSIVPLVTDALILEPLCGLFGTHAYYSGMLRESLLRAAQTTPSVLDTVDNISAAIDALSSQTVSKGIRPTTSNGVAVASLSPADSTGSVVARTPAQALNIFYIKRGIATSGGFFPAGVNGAINTSAA